MPISPRSPLHLPYISPISPPSSTFDIICDEPAPISPFHLPYISHISPPSSTFEIICDEPEAREHLAGIQRWKERHATKPDPCYYLTDEAGAAVQQNDDQLELWCAAAWVRPRVTAMMKRFAIPRHPGRGLKEHVAIKKHVRIAEKVMLRPGEMQRNANRVLDLVRDMYAAETIKEVAGVVDAMCRWEAIQVVRIKDRFAEPSAGGWRDCMINYVMKDDPRQHICELQITHAKMVTQRETLKAHVVYGRTRNAGELLECLAGDV